MSTLYIINNTIGDNVFSILPGALNGPGGTTADSDLRLYGQGTTQYGEGVNENLYKITESFACAEKILGDFLVGTDDPNAFVPGTGSYDPLVDPVGPKDQYDLGLHNGINIPLNGQPWFNTTRKKLMTYVDGDGFQFAGAPSAGATPPSSPTEGDLWYDTSIPQLKVYDDGTFGWLSAADRYIRLDGTSSMTGDLDLGTNQIINVVDPINPQDVSTMNYVDTEINLITGPGFALDTRYLQNEVDDVMNGNFTLNGTLTISNNIIMGNNAQILIDASSAALPGIAAAGNIDTGIFTSGTNVAFSTVGIQRLEITAGGALSVPIGYESSVTTDDVIPNKKYVDDEIAFVNGTASGAAKIYNATANPPAAGSGNKAGDIAISTTFNIYIATGIDNWNQVFPAVYN